MKPPVVVFASAPLLAMLFAAACARAPLGASADGGSAGAQGQAGESAGASGTAGFSTGAAGAAGETGQSDAAAGQGDGGDGEGDGDRSIADGPEPPGTWTNRTPTTPDPAAWPSARSNLAMAYDAARDRVVVYAGSHTLRDLWEWNPATGTWTNRTPATLPKSWPPPLYGHAMVYDAARKKIFVFGGGTTVGVLAQSWEWDGALGTWQRRITGSSPPALESHAMAYDSTRGKVLLFGGYDNAITGVSGSLWEWDGAAGTWTIPLIYGLAPRARDGATMVYDVARHLMVLFGGYDAMGHSFDDLWEWNAATGDWNNRASQIPGPGPWWPAARNAHAAVYDTHRQRTLIFGGAGANLATFEVWEWDGAGGIWTQQQPLDSSAPWPAARASHRAAWDEKRSTALIFGGCCDTNELWEWHRGR